MLNIEELDKLLKKLLASIPEVKAAAIISVEGLPISSALPQGICETRIAAMTATLLSLSERAIIELGKGNFGELYIIGSEGYIIVMQAGLNAVLTISTTENIALGLILLEDKRICKKIAQSLKE